MGLNSIILDQRKSCPEPSIHEWPYLDAMQLNDLVFLLRDAAFEAVGPHLLPIYRRLREVHSDQAGDRSEQRVALFLANDVRRQIVGMADQAEVLEGFLIIEARFGAVLPETPPIPTPDLPIFN